jgi:hypothetical protein
LRRLRQADVALLSDITDLPHREGEILSKPAVLDGYFPPEVCIQVRPYPDLIKGFKARSHRHTVLEAQPEGTTIEQQETRQGDDDRPSPLSRSQRQHHEIAAAGGDGAPKDEDEIAAQKRRNAQVDTEDEHELKKTRSR